jgi:HAAS domain-containing protein
MSTDDDQLVEDYLAQLRAEALVLPDDRREELVEEITAHIAEARQSDGSPMAVRNILDRLGDPADIVQAAADTPPGSPAWSGAPGSVTGHPVAAAVLPGRPGALEIAAVLFLLLGGIVIPFLGWAVGVVLLWLSPRWTTRDKLLGTLVWPGGLLAPALLLVAGAAAGLLAVSVTTCTSPPVVAPVDSAPQDVHQAAAHCTTSGGVGLPPWLFITLSLVLLALAVAGPLWTARRLLHRAGESPAQASSAAAGLITA